MNTELSKKALSRLSILVAINALSERSRKVMANGGYEMIVAENAGWELMFLKKEKCENVLITRERNLKSAPLPGTIVIWDQTETT